jgi:thiamine monophosphate kinase
VNGFRDIVFIGDSGGNQNGMKQVSELLNREWAGTGVRIDEAAVPVAAGVAEAAELLGLDPVELALGGGEDFVLAAALPPGLAVAGTHDCGAFTPDPAELVRVGTAGARPLAGLSWDHFRSPGR